MVAETIEALSQRAREAMEQRNWEKARQYYLQALGLKSDSPDVHQGLATVCFQLRDLPSAAYHFKEVTRLDPLRAGAYINLGAVYNLLGQLDEAVAVLRRGIQLDSQRPEGYYNLALVYRRKGQNDHAIQAYREALRVNPRMTDAHLNIANLYAEKQQHKLAIAHYRRALELRPNWDKAQNGLNEAEAALASHDQPAQLAPITAPVRTADTPAPSPPAMDRHVDPGVHGILLTTLHKATVESESFNRHFLKVLEGEIEPAIKELSSYLLHPDSSGTDLDHCVQRFENAIQSMRSAQRNLQSSIEKIRNIGDRLFQS
jgi:tetratricopeptide (TPR) repeat protein